MKILAIVFAAIGLSGCVAVPVIEPPGVYVGPPAPVVVVRPYVSGYYGYSGGHRHRWH